MRSRLAEISDIVYGKSPAEVADSDGSVPIIGTGGEYGRAYRPMFDAGVVVPRKGSLGNPQLVLGPFWPTDTTFAVLPSTATDTRWLYYCLLNYDLSKLNEATGVPSISRDWLSKIRFFNPGQPRQSRIADILQTIDQAIEKTETLIDKYQQIKAGLMHDLFTRGIGPDGQLRPPHEQAPELYQETPIGWIPREWEYKRLEALATVERGKFTARPRNDPQYYGEGYPFIQTGDVTGNLGRVLYSYSQSLNENGIAVSKSFPATTVMITIAANIADTCILGMSMYAPDSVVGVIANDTEDARYIERCINRKKAWLYAVAPQSAQRNINLEDLRPLLIPWPEKAERLKIAKRYETMESTISMFENELEKLHKNKTGLMNDLLTGKVPVQVEPEPEAEPEAAHV